MAQKTASTADNANSMIKEAEKGNVVSSFAAGAADGFRGALFARDQNKQSKGDEYAANNVAPFQTAECRGKEVGEYGVSR